MDIHNTICVLTCESLLFICLLAYFLILGTQGTLIHLEQNYYILSPAVMLASVHRISL